MTAATPLRLLLQLDAIGCALSGVAILIANRALASRLGGPARLWHGLAALLIAYATTLFVALWRPSIDPRVARFAIVFNVAWAADSLLTARFGWFGLTRLGAALTVTQAAAVATIAAAQWQALQRTNQPNT